MLRGNMEVISVEERTENKNRSQKSVQERMRNVSLKYIRSCNSVK